MADENKQIEMKKISTLDELDSLGTDSYTVVSKNGSSYKFDLSKVDLTEVNRELNAHTQQLEQHTERLNDLENELNGNLKISSIDENTLELENGKLSVIGGGTATGVSEEFVNNKIDEVKRLIDDKANETHKHEMSDVNGLLHDKQEVYQRRIDLTLREQTVVESINKNYTDIQNLQTDKVDKAENMELISTAEKQKLAAIADGAEVNVQSDWNETDTTSDAYIKNKPDLALYTTKAYVDEKIAQAGTGGNVDLSGYVTETELQNELNKKVNSADLKTVATSGSYIDLTDTPTIPTKTSELTNDSNFLTPTTIPAEYITEEELTRKGYLTEHQDLTDYAKKSDIPTDYATQTELAEVSGKVGTLETSNTTLTGNVTTLTGEVTNLKTTVQGINTTYATKQELTDGLDALHTVAKSGKYTDLIDTPTIPTKVSELANDSAFITKAELTTKGYLTQDSLNDYAKTSDIEATYATKEKLTEVSDKVTEVSGKVATLEASNTTLTGEVATLKTAYATKQELGEKADKTELTPIKTLLGDTALTTTSQTVTGGIEELKTSIDGLATVAKSGKYTDLIDKPDIPSKVSDLTNDSNYATKEELTESLNDYAKTSDIDTTYAKKQELTDGLSAKVNSTDLKTVATTGNYNDLENKPTIPTTVAQLTDSNIYALKTDIPNLATVATSGSYTDLTNTPTLFSGSYNDLTEKPIIPSIDGLVYTQTLQDVVEPIDVMAKANKAIIDGTITYDNGAATIQQLIDEASVTTHYVKLQPKTYEIETSIKPKPNVVLDLNGATLYLKNGVEKPMFRGDGANTDFSNFTIMNGTLDLNQDNNHAGNESAGGIWFLNEDHLYFYNLTVLHAHRNIFNFYTCTDVKIKDVYCKDCGTNASNNLNYFTYGASFERQCKNIEVDNFNMVNIYGYGIHLRKTTQAKLKNIYFENFTKPDSTGSGVSIGITFTEADNVVLDNYTHIKGDGLSIECNQSTNIVMNNLLIDNVKVPFVFGVNASDQSEERNQNIKINNLVTTNTTSQSECSLRLNYIYGMVIENFNVDKGMETLANKESTDIVLRNGKFGIPIKKSYHNERFFFENVEFPTNNADFPTVTLKKYNGRNVNEIYLPKISIEPSASKQMHIGTEILNLRGTEPIFFKLLVYSHSTTEITKASFTEYMVIVYGESTAVYLKELASVDGAEAKKVTVEVNNSKQGLKLTNSTDATLDIYVKTY